MIPQPATAHATAATSAPPTATSRPRVVLVDPYVPLRCLVAELLTDAGMQVVGVLSDPTGLLEVVAAATARHGGVDVVVLDERLPRKSGLWAAQQLRSFAPQIRVVLHTALAGWLGTAPRTLGVVAEVAKGSHPQQLIDTILAACQTTNTRAAHAR